MVEGSERTDPQTRHLVTEESRERGLDASYQNPAENASNRRRDCGEDCAIAGGACVHKEHKFDDEYNDPVCKRRRER